MAVIHNIYIKVCDMLVLGVDPGSTGAISLLDDVTHDLIEVVDLPFYEVKLKTKTKNGNVRKRKKLDCYKIACMMKRYARLGVKVVYLEEVHAMNNDGSVQAFSFGECFGILKMAIAAAELQCCMITPRQWKDGLSLLGSDKDDARKMALELWPTVNFFKRKKDHNRADSALLALYSSKVASCAIIEEGLTKLPQLPA